MPGDDPSGDSSYPGAGFGNKTAVAPDEEADTDDLRFDKHKNMDPYSNHQEFGSGATGGAGFGNKSNAAGDPETLDSSDIRLGKSDDTNPYSGHTGIGSGSTAGAGYGNKTAEFGKTDSTRGKLREKLGVLLGKDDMVEQGTAMRDEVRKAEEEEEEAVEDGGAIAGRN